MQKETIDNRELMEAVRKVAPESGLSENEQNGFLDERAFEFGYRFPSV